MQQVTFLIDEWGMGKGCNEAFIVAPITRDLDCVFPLDHEIISQTCSISTNGSGCSSADLFEGHSASDNFEVSPEMKPKHRSWMEHAVCIELSCPEMIPKAQSLQYSKLPCKCKLHTKGQRSTRSVDIPNEDSVDDRSATTNSFDQISEMSFRCTRSGPKIIDIAARIRAKISNRVRKLVNIKRSFSALMTEYRLIMLVKRDNLDYAPLGLTMGVAGNDMFSTGSRGPSLPLRVPAQSWAPH